MRITIADGTVFEGTIEEYFQFAFAAKAVSDALDIQRMLAEAELASQGVEADSAEADG